jgi:hypothetical protein
MKRLFGRKKNMAIRAYRRPLLNPNYGPAQMGDASKMPELNYEEVFVILETPLLEFTQKDLVFLRERGIDPFRD